MSHRGPSRVRAFARSVGREALTVAVLGAAYIAAVVLRLGAPVPPDAAMALMRLLPVVIGVEYALLRWARVHRRLWRFTSLSDAVAIATALGGAHVALLAGAFAILGVPAVTEAVDLGWEPTASRLLGLVGVSLLTAVPATLGVRVLARIAMERRPRPVPPAGSGVRGVTPRTRALVVGAGPRANELLRDLALDPERAPLVVGLLDDDPSTHLRELRGVSVLGGTDVLERHARERGADVLVVADDTLDRPRLRRLLARARDAGLDVRVRAGGIADPSPLDGPALRPLDAADLLARPSLALEPDRVRGQVEGRVVLVTGAAGTIGAEVCRELARLGPARIVGLDRAEAGLHALAEELATTLPLGTFVPVVADVGDAARLGRVLGEHGPAIVVHAAALGHVPLLESNVGAAVTDNVRATATLVDACLGGGVLRLVLLSSVKSVAPTSVMGASKRVAERIVQDAAARSRRAYVVVRLGNVLGAAASVVPLIDEQIRRGGPVRVTHPAMVRRFVTLREAARLTLEAIALERGGAVLVADAGEPLRILDLARDLIRLRGLDPEHDVPIEFTGTRPGERLEEPLTLPSETVAPTAVPGVLVAAPAAPRWPERDAVLAELDRLATTGLDEAARAALFAAAGVPLAAGVGRG